VLAGVRVHVDISNLYSVVKRISIRNLLYHGVKAIAMVQLGYMYLYL
jgi:hypothetical protein